MAERFEPIAIVGRACVLPGALDPEALWQAVREGRDLITSAPAGRWGLEREAVLTTSAEPEPDRCFTDRGGYVQGFEALFDPQGFAVDAERIAGLDPLFQWSLHCARGALEDAGLMDGRERARCGAILGNLSFPSRGLSRLAERVWLEASGLSTAQLAAAGLEPAPDPRERFMSSLPAELVCEALELGATCFCLDAACASSLYAVKLACDRLHDRRADSMLAGGVNRADDLFIHMGYSAIRALSPTGRSRPFHREADGLLPAEGAAFVALMRLADAERLGRPVLAVLRGVGLANDGRGKGLLAPNERGQIQAMRRAWSLAGLDPCEAGLLECHATGTRLGDGVEIGSSAQVFAGCRDLPAGSVKSNLGHLSTAAGGAGLIKVIEALQAGIRPPSLHLDPDSLHPQLEGTPLRPLLAPEPWEGRRLAAVSAFGFGGNDAHLVLEQHGCPDAPSGCALPEALRETSKGGRLAVVGLGICAGSCTDARAFARALFTPGGRLERGEVEEIVLPLEGLRFPPRDLEQCLAQQLLLLSAADQALAQAGRIDAGRCGVWVGMEADCEVARYGLRWRLAHYAASWGLDLDAEALCALRDRVVAALRAAGVLGSMPNMPANRLNSSQDLQGPSGTVSAGEASGLVALDIAARALRCAEIDAALVGAVDLCCEEVHRRAARELGRAHEPASDAAVVLALEREEDALRAGKRILFAIEGDGGQDGEGDSLRLEATGEARRREASATGDLSLGLSGSAEPLGARFGHAGAASGLLHLAAAGLCVQQGRRPGGEALRSGAGDRRARVEVETCGRVQAWNLCQAADRMERGESEAGQAELALVFTGAGAAYPGMGRALLAALPELADCLERGEIEACLEPFREGGREASALEMLWGASALCQLHARLALDVLGLRPGAVIGYSSGESNALFATGAWSEMGEMRRRTRESGLFDRLLGGGFELLDRLWGERPEGWSWESWLVRAEAGALRGELDGQERVFLTCIHTDVECLIAGERGACARVVEAIGPERCQRLGYDLVVHVPLLGELAPAWLDLHRRPVSPVPGVRFYSCAPDLDGCRYQPSTETCAQVILGQAAACIDFRRTVRQAYCDGVRVFVECGPGSVCTRWIQQILSGEPGVTAISLDRRGGSAEGLAEVRAALQAAGLEEARPQPASVGRSLRLPAHPAPVRISLQELGMQSKDRNPAGPVLQPMPPAHPAPVRISLQELEMQSKDGNPAGPALQPMPPAHPAPVRISLQELEMQSKDGNPAGPALQPMPPAPALPPVLTGEPFEPAAAAAAVARPPSAPRARPLPRLPAAAYREWQSGLSRVHQDFVEQQSRLHEQFLAMRAGALEMLLRTGGAPADLAARAVPPLGALPAAAEPARGREQPPDRALTRKDTGAAPRILGLRLDRGKLETHASGRISEVFGPLFARQDHFPRQVRMPEPPLLLADRVIGLEAEPGSMGRGVIWTETDVSHDSWYLHEGHVPPGILIEAGQADLMLISYLGIDFHNQGERVYRLLGCELTYGELPRPGDRLQYEIRVDGHARQGDVRLFFFHSECRSQQDGALRLAVTGGQAGFFTDEELAESKGVLWEPEQEELEPEPRLDPPAVCCSRERFDAVQVRAFAEGRAADCFGPGFELCWTHSRTPRIPSGMLCLLDEVEDFQPEGGPWGRGYLRAVKQLAPDDWFFPGHFKNDPCMPGTLMFEGSLQAMAFYLAAMGTTCRRDGWRFQPVCGEPFALKSRGQATPRSRQLLYEVFVRDFVSGPVPTLHADLLCTVDGLKAFHARRVGLQLVPDWPLSSRHELVAEAEADARPAAEVDGFRYDYRSLLACAWGKPSEAFGPIAEVFDGARRVARLPSPPYHFMSRLTRIDAGLGEFRPGGRIELDYDIPPDAWYFEQNGCPRMPFAVLLEAALQPCGWLAIFVGSALQIDEELSFRNLDGTGRVLREIGPGDGTLRTRVKLKTISRTTGTIIESFDVTCELASGERVYELETVFGFFPQEALAAQVGLPTSEQQRELLEAPSDFELDLASEPARYCRGEPRLAGSMLRMLDRVTGFWPEGGKAGLGALRAEKDVRADEWFFKAHFFQDPVQPGSLGLEAMIQLLQFYMLETDMQAGVPAARFEPLALDRTMRWKYRGQVLPHNRLISTSLEIIERGRDERGPYAVAEASLWIDGRRIYEASGLGMRIVPGEEAAEAQPGADVEHPGEIVLDPERERWLLDHRPTWTRPALPLMCMLDLMARAAQGPGKLVGMRSVQARRWVIFDGARRLRVEREGDELRLVECAEQGDQEVASARIVLAGDYPEAPPAWEPVQGEPVEDLYSAGRIFHGPAFQLARSLVLGERGASWNLDFESCPVPRGALLPAVLDGATHGIPHDRLHLWSDEIGVDRIAYPAMVTELILFGPPPEKGPLRCEARFDGFFGSVDYPAFRVQIIEPGGKVWASFRQVEACFTKGPLGRAEPEARMAFLRDRAYAAGISLARTDAEGATRLTEAEVDAMDWFPGTVEAVYGTRDLRRLAIKDHLAREMEIHPGKLPEGLPLSRFHYQSDWEGEEIAVRSTGEAELDTEPIQKYWAEWFHRSRWPVEDLFQALVNRFVRRVVLDDAAAFEAVRGRSAVYLANHQVGLESLLFSILASGLTGLQALTLAKIEHKTTWLGRLIALCFAYPGVPAPRVISFFDREDRESLPRILAELANTMSAAQGKSIMVHVEGTRSLSCRRPVQRMSGLFVDLALEVGAPIVPVRFVGGLPVEPLAERIEFPIGYCKQDFWFGRPIWPDELAPLPLGKRTRKLMDAINALGPPNAREEPHAPDADFAAGVQAWIEATGARPEHAVILRALQELPDPSQETERLLSAVESGELTTGPELEDQWLAELARWLFGPRGPAVL